MADADFNEYEKVCLLCMHIPVTAYVWFTKNNQSWINNGHVYGKAKLHCNANI